jgi:hypothetical protein
MLILNTITILFAIAYPRRRQLHERLITIARALWLPARIRARRLRIEVEERLNDEAWDFIHAVTALDSVKKIPHLPH